MLRTTILVFLVLTSIAVVSADIIPLDTRCSEAEHDGKSISDVIRDDSRYNCIDVVCAVVDVHGRPIRVSDGTLDADASEPLLGNRSYILTQATTDLRQLSGECATRAFNASYCSVRGEWELKVAIVRHYDRHSSQDRGTQWGSEHNAIFSPWQFREVNRVNHEVAVQRVRDAYHCEDTLPPQLRFNDDFNLRTGERELTITFSDKEWEYHTEHSVISLLMNPSADEDRWEHFDSTTLDTCEYSLTPGEDPDTWTPVDCAGQYEYSEGIEDVPSGTRYLHLRASDTAGNLATETFELDEYYPSLGNQGWCPRENECFVYEHGNRTFNTFEAYITKNIRPACVEIGHGAGNVYCSEEGTIERSHALLSYGVSELGTGVVYCGSAPRITGVDAGTQAACSRLPEALQTTCAFTCVISEDPNPSAWQQSAAVFATNNFLTHTLETDDERIYTPLALLAGVQYDGSYARTTNCQWSGAQMTCEAGLIMGQGSLSESLTVTYHNTSGLASMSQTMSIGSPDTISPLNAPGEFITQLNNYIVDIGQGTPPQYDTSLDGLTRIAAYRKAGSKTITGLTTSSFTATGRAGEASTSTRVVAVVFEGFNENERAYINQAKDAIGLVATGPIRSIETPVQGGGSPYVLLVAVRNEDAAHEMLERLVVRLRVGS